MRNYFTFAGKDCRDFSLYINGHKTFNSPERDYSLYEVPGRSGSIAEDDGTFKNVELAYESSFIFEEFDKNFSNLKNYLLSKSGYQRLVDTYHPDEYRMAIFRKAIEPTMNESNEVGAFDLIFECQPQRFLLSGEKWSAYERSEDAPASVTMRYTITNPTLFVAKPLYKVWGKAGKFLIGSHTVSIAQEFPYDFIFIDADTMDSYYTSLDGSIADINCNQYVSFSSYESPVIHPGDNTLAIYNGITQVSIQPRWYRI